MSREILFRGKRLDNGKWIEGDGIHYPKSINYLGSCWIDDIENRANYWSQVDPATVGQFTGLKDKNGKNIFEGDIVKPVDDGTVSAREWTAAFGKHHEIRWVKQDMGDFFGTVYVGFEVPLYAQSEFIEIIGNIHDNPELLKS